MLLEKCCSNVIIAADNIVVNDNFITFKPHCINVDNDKELYMPELHKDKLNIHVVHGMLMDHKPNFDKFVLIDELRATDLADITITGHYHPGFGIKSIENKSIINLGSICRREATKTEMSRTIKIGLIETEGYEYTISEHSLKCVNDGDSVLSDKHLKSKKETDAIKEDFNEVLKHAKANKAFANVEDMILYIANETSVNKAVRDEAIKRIADKRKELDEKEMLKK